MFWHMLLQIDKAMLNIFTHIGYNVAPRNTEGNKLPLMMIKNPDGSPRWIWHAGAKKPYFLKFYNISGLRPLAFAIFCHVVFLLRIQRLFFANILVKLQPSGEQPILLNVFESKQWAMFTGTVGPNNKLVVFHRGAEGNEFIKIAPGRSAQKLIDNEFKTISLLDEMIPVTFGYPRAKKESDSVLRLSDISYAGERVMYLTDEHKGAIYELTLKTGVNSEKLRGKILTEVSNKLHTLSYTGDERIPRVLINKLQEIYDTYENKSFKMALNHGDFTPWNMYSNVAGINIYDWELADYLPVGFDAFHFIIQKGVMQQRKSWKQIREEIDLFIPEEVMNRWTKQSSLKRDDYLKLYLLVNVTRYLYLYSKQEEWHVQINWLLGVWHDALADLTKRKNGARGQFILDVFSYLQGRSYAAIKFPNISPDLLPKSSDIDLCIQKKDYKAITQYIKTHPSVKHITIEKKSFMATARVFLENNAIICLDLIWKFKRKGLVMMDAQEVIKNSVTNIYGVKNMEVTDLARYIGLFYGLNNQEIPKHYQPIIMALRNQKEKLDQIIFKGLIEHEVPNATLTGEVLKAASNQGMKKWTNQLNYLGDIVREMLFQKGLIITFSGVDGAGKSTIIEKTKYELEKKLRKRVVVLRHRPSVLPILSAWTKGKAKAEQDAADTLPRQGGNKSFIGSLLRFAYYYADYFFGQFYVHLRYVSRGYVVLYDRYYFDFINDSKRSNIQLPKRLLNLGYALLFSPDLNFFLYAKPEVILERKKELDYATISSLTDSYLNLFGSLSKTKRGAYIPVENIALDETLQTIMQQALPKIA
jgi:thymidylate kinase